MAGFVVPGRRTFATLGSGSALVGTFLPWITSGSRSRSSYDLFGVVERLGFAPDGAVGWAIRLWPLVPLLLVTTVVTHSIADGARRIRITRTAVTALTVAYAGGVALAIRLAPDVGTIQRGVGPTMTLIGAGVLAASLRGARRPGPRARLGAPPDDRS
ncbi:MAG: hypothetical protein RLZZ01_1463 [Actinomycetota bacterium]|jgi:hypothetical protein